jgi:predicted DCC family thiol-disulfide oxidoreductase YuxK
MNGTVLFDSNCNLCNGLVRFIKRKDIRNRFRFVSLKSEEGRRILLAAGLPEYETGTAVYIDERQFHLRSSAVLHILKNIDGTWKILYVFIFIPAFIRDFIYRFIANNRHRFYGKNDSYLIN